MENQYSRFLIESGLYGKIEISETSIKDLIELIKGTIKIDVFCKECGEKRVFNMKPLKYYDYSRNDSFSFREKELSQELLSIQQKYNIQRSPYPDGIVREKEWYWQPPLLNEYTRVMVFSFACSMNEKHHLDYVVLTNNSEMIKIGQYPSIADLSFPELLEFKQVIDKESIREFRTALGLFAHGIGIGSYVYLRRIFESIINIVAREYIESGLIDKNDYEKMHMDERIKFLKTDLPETIADNPVIYKIISKGIHEMSEEECKAYFPVLKDCIYLIIEQWERIRTENETKRQLERSIQDISAGLRENEV